MNHRRALLGPVCALLGALALAGCGRAHRSAAEVEAAAAASAAASTATASAAATVSAAAPPVAEEVDLGHLFPGMEATFVLLDTKANRIVRHDPGRARQRFVPASTYKIPNSLIALETGVATGAEFALRWDSAAAPPAAYWPASWKGDQTLRSAFRNSVVWYYQELARRIGEERMSAYLERFAYGNRELSGGVDRFWLSGGLRISPDEQVEFLRRFYFGELGVSDRTTAMVKDLMILEATPEYRLGGKTGTADVTPTRELGWLVGYVERGEAVYLYALNIEGEQVWEEWGPTKRVELVRAALRELGVLPREADGVHQVTPDLRVTALEKDVWLHTSWRTVADWGNVPSNGLIIREGDELTLIDTAWGEEHTEALLAWIDTAIGLPVARVVSTHFHDDRVGGGETVRRRGIAHLAHPLTRRLAAEEGNPVPDALPGLEAVGSSTRIGPVEVFYPGAAHAPDNVVVYVPARGVLFGGCAVRDLSTTSPGNLSHADTAAWPVSIARVRARYAQARRVVPGHGEPGGIELLDHTIAIFR